MSLPTITFQRAQGNPEPREWMPDENGVPMVRCDCGCLSRMANHEIKPDGTVVGSIGCPKVCGFHVYGRLEGWTP